MTTRNWFGAIAALAVVVLPVTLGASPTDIAKASMAPDEKVDESRSVTGNHRSTLAGAVAQVVQCPSCRRILYLKDEVKGALVK